MTPTTSNERAVATPTASQAPRGRLDVAGLTHVGRMRPRNEDAYLIATLQRSMVVHDASPEAARGWVAGEAAGTLLVVADGMGGQGSGDVASQVAVQTIAGYLLNVMPWVIARTNESMGRESAPSLIGMREQLSTALVAGDTTVKAAGVETGSPRMGTTLTMALVLWPVLYVAHVGDTRCYLWRGGQLKCLTTDHTVAQQLAAFSPEPLDPGSAFHNMLWNSLGGSEQIPSPQVVKTQVEVGDMLVLCSDGLTKHVTDAEIASALAGQESNAARCGRLVDRANAEGGSDNVTVVIASVQAE